MRVLVVGFVWPEPKSSAAGQNILSYINTCVEQGWQVSFCSAAEQTEQAETFLTHNVEAMHVSLNSDTFDALVLKLSPDIVLFDRFLCFEQFAWRVKKTCPQAMLVLDAEDLHFLRKARHEIYKANTNTDTYCALQGAFEKDNATKLYNDIAIRELACIYQADVTLMLSEAEEKLLINTFNVPKNQVSHVPFILDEHAGFSSVIKTFDARADFMFIGNFRHAPNYHAAKHLREKIWPTIYKKLKGSYPNIACHIYGAYLSPKAKQLENKALRFFVHGFAHNQFEVIENARVMLAPITFGAGVKGKLLDAMQCRTPSVTTHIGAEGITSLNWPGEVVNDVESFIQAAINLYGNEGSWQTASDKAANIIEQNFNSILNKETFLNALTHTFTHLHENRKHNFMQQMLAHHQFQSSKYMSQWIEAKNK